MENYPLITVEFKGTSIISNAQLVLEKVKEISDKELTRELKNDEDFANKEALIKSTKETRKQFKAAVGEAKKNYESLEEFTKATDEIDSILQKIQSHGEKQIKEEKARKKADIMNAGEKKWGEYYNEQLKNVTPVILCNVTGFTNPDYQTAIKGKKTFASCEKSVEEEFNSKKEIVAQIVEVIKGNMEFLRNNCSGYEFLFNDLNQIASLPNEQLSTLALSRVETHKRQEDERIEREKERLRIENEKKLEAERKKIQEEEERKAKEKIEAEQKKQDFTDPSINKTADPSYCGSGQLNPDIQHAEQKQLSDIEFDRQQINNFRNVLNEVRVNPSNMKTEEGKKALKVFYGNLRAGFEEIKDFMEG